MERPRSCRLPCIEHLDKIEELLVHYHHACWSCGREVISRAAASYDCTRCDVTSGAVPYAPWNARFDPDFAATASCP